MPFISTLLFFRDLYKGLLCNLRGQTLVIKNNFQFWIFPINVIPKLPNILCNISIRTIQGCWKANNNNIAVSKRQAGRFAVYRYSGRWTEARDKEARQTLAKWIDEQNLTLMSVMEKASYDPPFTPPFMRRNEILVRIDE